jgi:carboxypeptidase C (cathepsin A)
MDEIAAEKAQRSRATDEVTNKVTNDLSSYTTYEKFLLAETGAGSQEEDTEMEEAKDTIKKELLKAETDSAEAAREAREEQVKSIQDKDKRHAENDVAAGEEDGVD